MFITAYSVCSIFLKIKFNDTISQHCSPFLHFNQLFVQFTIRCIALFFISLFTKHLYLQHFVLVYEPGNIIQELSKMSVRMAAKFGKRLILIIKCCLLQIPEDDPVSNILPLEGYSPRLRSVPPSNRPVRQHGENNGYDQSQLVTQIQSILPSYDSCVF